MTNPKTKFDEYFEERMKDPVFAEVYKKTYKELEAFQEKMNNPVYAEKFNKALAKAAAIRYGQQKRDEKIAYTIMIACCVVFVIGLSLIVGALVYL